MHPLVLSAENVKVGRLEIGNCKPLVLIAGPCALEGRNHALEMAHALVELSCKLNIGLIYKTSFDKANRTSIDGSRGVGAANGLPILAEVRERYACPVLTDIHDVQQCSAVAEVVDVLQIPALLCRQTDLLIAAAQTGRAINVKKGQFLAPWDMKHVAEKIKQSGNSSILLCERGTSFGYNRLISDMRALPILAETGYPVVFDATHSVQEPGGKGTRSGGRREFVPILARAAVSVGIAALFVETHQDPDRAPSDGPNMMHLSGMEDFIRMVMSFDQVVKKQAWDNNSSPHLAAADPNNE